MASAPTLAADLPPEPPWRVLLMLLGLAALFWCLCLAPLGWFPGSRHLR